MLAYNAVLALALLLRHCTALGLPTAATAERLLPPPSSCRRALLSAGGAAAAALCAPPRADAAAPPGFIEGRGGVAERVAGVGGGFDMLSEKPLADVDVLYPPSLNGTWVCERRVVAVEGDVDQARGAWKLLGGTGDFQKSEEKYYVRFVDLRRPTDGIIGLDGKKYYGGVLDRAYEMEQRTGSGTAVKWDPFAPNALKYERPDGGPATELRVVQRAVEPQNNQGSLVGSNELIRVTTKASGPFNTSFDVVYAARVQRRWRRSTTAEGDRVVEGLEIVKTYRVLDGVAGLESPSSTVKSTLRLDRTYPTRPGSGGAGEK